MADPDHLAEAMLGLRAWVGRCRAGASRPSLLSVIAGWPWPPRAITTASCRRKPNLPDHAHQAPVVTCDCGYYAVDPRRAAVRLAESVSVHFVRVWLTDVHASDWYLGRHDGLVVGLVWLWGTVICGNTGVWRATHAYPAAFVAFPASLCDRAAQTAGAVLGRTAPLLPSASVRWLGRIYGVPVVAPPLTPTTQHLVADGSLVLLDRNQVATLTALVRGLELARVSTVMQRGE